MISIPLTKCPLAADSHINDSLRLRDKRSLIGLLVERLTSSEREVKAKREVKPHNVPCHVDRFMVWTFGTPQLPQPKNLRRFHVITIRHVAVATLANLLNAMQVFGITTRCELETSDRLQASRLAFRQQALKVRSSIYLKLTENWPPIHGSHHFNICFDRMGLPSQIRHFLLAPKDAS